MGEAGPEAVMPLTRMSGGKLGVQMTGGGGHVISSAVSVVYHAAPGTSHEDGARQASKFVSSVKDMIGQQVDERIIRHLQSGGMLNQ